MKCSNCGEEEFFFFFVFNVRGEIYSASFPLSYVCAKCGHIELFETNIVEEYNGIKEEILKLSSKIDELNKLKQTIELNIFAAENEIEELEKQIKSEEITVRQYNELSALIEKKKNHEELIKNRDELKKLKQEIISSQHKLDNLNIRLKKFNPTKL